LLETRAIIAIRRRGLELSLIAAKRAASERGLSNVKQLPVNVAHILPEPGFTRYQLVVESQQIPRHYSPTLHLATIDDAITFASCSKKKHLVLA